MGELLGGGNLPQDEEPPLVDYVSLAVCPHCGWMAYPEEFHNSEDDKDYCPACDLEVMM